jgi:DNA-binding CsgD family transcriptional regulator
MAGGAEGEQGVRVVLATADVAAGDALAFACARRGVQVSVADVGSRVPAEVVLVDLRAEGAATAVDVPGLRGNGVRRVVAIGAALGGTVGSHLDAWVGLDADIDELIAAITGTVRSRPRPGAEATSDLERLTPREREVMALLLAGLGADSMGGQLGISANTVRTHLQNVLAKLGVNSRAEAAAWALRSGLEPADVDGEAVT